MMSKAKIKYLEVNAGTPPNPMNFRGRASKWRDLFESMKRNDWFVIPKKDFAKTSAAASTYLKGRYSLYKINDRHDYCLIKIR
jgi:hypothetical protein